MVESSFVSDQVGFDFTLFRKHDVGGDLVPGTPDFASNITTLRIGPIAVADPMT